MSYLEIEDIFDDEDNDEADHEIISDKAAYTDRRRRLEDRLEMLRMKEELGLDSEFLLAN